MVTLIAVPVPATLVFSTLKLPRVSDVLPPVIAKYLPSTSVSNVVFAVNRPPSCTSSTTSVSPFEAVFTAPPADGIAHVLSPRKNVEAEGVPVADYIAISTAPLDMVVALVPAEAVTSPVRAALCSRGVPSTYVSEASTIPPTASCANSSVYWVISPT